MYSEQRDCIQDPGLAASWLESHLTNKKVNGQVVGGGRDGRVGPQAASSWVDSLKGTRVYDGSWPRLGGAWAGKTLRRPFSGPRVGTE